MVAADGGGRYRKRAAVMAAAVTESVRPLQAAVMIQEAGGGRDGGRYINNALRQEASTNTQDTSW